MPHVSPDGTRIAFASNRTQDGSIWTMRANGRRERLLFGLTGSDEWHPRYSPDGSQIAFTRLLADGAEEPWVMRSDGTSARRVTAGAEPAWRP